MFKRIKGFIRMKREQRWPRRRMSKETYQDLDLLWTELLDISILLDEDAQRCKDEKYSTIFHEYNYKVFRLWSKLGDIMYDSKRR